MYKRIDITENEKLEGFSYVPHMGYDGLVTISLPNVLEIINLEDEEGNCINIHRFDIDNLIKALEAVKKHI